MFYTLVDETVTAPTVSAIFEQAGDTMTGIVTMCGNFFTALWDNPMGKVVITLGLVSAAVGLCYRLFLRRKHV